MIEMLGPSLARAVVGDDYDPDYKYELETDDSGMRVIVTNMKDGTSTVKELEDTYEEEPYKPDPIWDLRQTLTTANTAKSRNNLILTLLGAAIFCIIG